MLAYSRIFRRTPTWFLNKFSMHTRETEEPPFLELTRDFLDPKEFYQVLSRNSVNFYTGVPDSLLKDFCAYISDHVDPKNHIITANEGQAIALATGYHLATSKIPLVYLQNSGLGNIVNPIMSLAHSKVYGIPMILLIGWRGEPGKKDEPQHLVQGKTMNGIITEMGLQFEVLPDYIEGAEEAVTNAVYNAKKRKTPYVLIAKRQNFTSYKLQNKPKNDASMSREQALQAILETQKPSNHDIFVCTTGFLSREVFELRQKMKQTNDSDFLCVGSMGYASSIAMGIARQKTSRNVWCLDGDGAALMHMGALAVIGSSGQNNLKHVIFNNECHDSVGGQPTVGKNINFCQIAEGCGYKKVLKVQNIAELQSNLEGLRECEGPALLEIKIKPGARKDLGRPKGNPIDNKEKFMSYLEL